MPQQSQRRTVDLSWLPALLGAIDTSATVSNPSFNKSPGDVAYDINDPKVMKQQGRTSAMMPEDYAKLPYEGRKDASRKNASYLAETTAQQDLSRLNSQLDLDRQMKVLEAKLAQMPEEERIKLVYELGKQNNFVPSNVKTPEMNDAQRTALYSKFQTGVNATNATNRFTEAKLTGAQPLASKLGYSTTAQDIASNENKGLEATQQYDARKRFPNIESEMYQMLPESQRAIMQLHQANAATQEAELPKAGWMQFPTGAYNLANGAMIEPPQYRELSTVQDLGNGVKIPTTQHTYSPFNIKKPAATFPKDVIEGNTGQQQPQLSPEELQLLQQYRNKKALDGWSTATPY